MNDLPTLMRARVESEHPDLFALTTGSIRRGRRIRHVRYAGAALASAAVVAGVALGAITLAGGHPSATEVQPAAGQSLDISSPAPRPSPIPLDLSPVTGGKLVVPPKAASGVHSLENLTPMAPGTVGPRPERKPFRVTLKGWTCGPAADEKFDCIGPTDDGAHVVWRPASDHADWANGSPDKQADWVSGVHDGVFVTIDGAAAQELGASLVWK